MLEALDQDLRGLIHRTPPLAVCEVDERLAVFVQQRYKDPVSHVAPPAEIKPELPQFRVQPWELA